MRALAFLTVSVSVFACSNEVGQLTDAGNAVDAPVVDLDAAFEPWRESNHAARIAFQVDNQERDPLVEFPLAVRFVGSSSRMGENGEQIVFHDGEQRLAHEVERIGLDSLIWVRSDLSGLSTIWMYFDNPAAEQLSSGASTFSAFESVYHFSDTFSQAPPDLLDDAVGNNDLNVSGLDSDSHQVDGLGLAVRYPLNSQFFAETEAAVPGLTLGDNQALSYEVWFKVPIGGANRSVISNFSPVCEGMHVYFGDGTPEAGDGSADVGEGLLHAGFFTATQCADTSSDRALLVTSGRFDDNRWHHVAFTVNRSAASVELFVDGVSVGTTTGGNKTGRTTTSQLRLGNNSRNQFSGLDGTLDEVRIGEIRSADWYAATFKNGHPKSDIDNPTDFVTAAAIEERP